MGRKQEWMSHQEGAARETEAEPALSGQRDVSGSARKSTSVLRKQRNIHEGSEVLTGEQYSEMATGEGEETGGFLLLHRWRGP